MPDHCALAQRSGLRSETASIGWATTGLGIRRPSVPGFPQGGVSGQAFLAGFFPQPSCDRLAKCAATRLMRLTAATVNTVRTRPATPAWAPSMMTAKAVS